MKPFIYAAAAAILTLNTVTAQEDGSPVPAKQPSQIAESQTKTPPENAGKQITAFQKASTFVGMAVVGPDGHTIAKVNDLIFDPEKGTIGYIVLEMEGGENGSKRLVPAPLSSVKQDGTAQQLVLNMSESVLLASAGVDAENLPPADIFAVGSAAGSEQGSGASSERENEGGSSSQPAGGTAQEPSAQPQKERDLRKELTP